MRPTEPAERANDRIYQQSVEKIGPQERYPSTVQSEVADTQPRQTNVDYGPGKVCTEKYQLPVLCHNNETHGPSDDAERHPKTDPAKDFHGLNEFSGIEQGDDQRRESQRDNNPWSC